MPFIGFQSIISYLADQLFTADDQEVVFRGERVKAYHFKPCRELAKSSPEKAVDNADSIIFFATGQYLSLLAACGLY